MNKINQVVIDALTQWEETEGKERTKHVVKRLQKAINGAFGEGAYNVRASNDDLKVQCTADTFPNWKTVVTVYGYFNQDFRRSFDDVIFQIRRDDTSDYEYRLAQEKKLYGELTALNEQVKRLRESAEEMIQRLPCPPSEIRTQTFFWEKASVETRSEFPYLFADLKE